MNAQNAHAAHQTAIKLASLRAEAARIAHEIATVEPTAANKKAADAASRAANEAGLAEDRAYRAWLDA